MIAHVTHHSHLLLCLLVDVAGQVDCTCANFLTLTIESQLGDVRQVRLCDRIKLEAAAHGKAILKLGLFQLMIDSLLLSAHRFSSPSPLDLQVLWLCNGDVCRLDYDINLQLASFDGSSITAGK